MIDNLTKNKLGQYFYKAFINNQNEFIANPKTNSFFRLEDCSTERDVIIKILHFVIRDCEKAGIHISHKKYLSSAVNNFLDTNFSKEDFYNIYGYLGNGVNSDLTNKFIDSGFDMEIFKG